MNSPATSAVVENLYWRISTGDILANLENPIEMLLGWPFGYSTVSMQLLSTTALWLLGDYPIRLP